MEKRRLGRTDLHISRIGLGAWAFGGGDWAFGWGDQEDADSVATIRRAVERGVSWIDTAPVYGHGHAEVVVGRALRDMAPSERPLVFTKCGLAWSDRGKIRHNLTRDSIRRELTATLRRLGVESVDLYQIHWPAYPPDSAAPDIEEGWETLSRLKEEGQVRHIGVSNFDVGQLDRIRSIADVASLQPPYSLLRRDVENEILPYCREHDIGVVVYSPLASGLLSGKMTRERVASLPANDWRKTKSLDFKEPLLSEHLELVERMRSLGARKGLTPAEIAISWVLRHPAVTAAIVGARRPGQLEETVGAVRISLHDDDVEDLCSS